MTPEVSNWEAVLQAKELRQRTAPLPGHRLQGSFAQAMEAHDEVPGHLGVAGVEGL